MPKPRHEHDADRLQDCIVALITGMGRGGLTHVAKRLGTTPSNLRKRLASQEGAFDSITMRAVVLAMQTRDEHPAPGGSKVGIYTVAKTQDGPRWAIEPTE